MTRQTEIMATVADIRCTPEFVAALRRAGIGSVRINSAHVDPDSIRRMTAIIRGVDPAIRLLMDTKGPEIRTTSLRDGIESVTLATGSTLTITGDPDSPTDATCIAIAVGGLDRHMKAGDTLLLDDGAIELSVTGTTAGGVTARVERGSELGSRKTVAAPGVALPPLPAVSDRDRINIAAARECGFDMIAHSFVRSTADVEALRRELEGSDITLYSKIECAEAVDNLESILEASDGLLIARGDLGTQVPIERIPAIQHRIARLCREAGKSVIVATQMLDSMMQRPYPTRAEVSDIALAVMEHIGTLLLTGETARGEYPVECVDIMRRTIEETERYDRS